MFPPFVDCYIITSATVLLTDSCRLAPVPRKKEGRAARLAAMMEADGTAPPSTDAAGKEVKAANDVKDVDQDVKDVKDVKDAQPAEGGKDDATKENVEPRNTQLLNKGEEPLAKETTV